MKIKSSFAIILAISLLVSAFAVPASAKPYKTNSDIEIIIENENISAETKAKIEKYYSEENHNDDGATTYGLTCTLLGHKLEKSCVTTITHKVRTTSPRCLKKVYAYEACTRCDYETSEVISTLYIACCS
ncbi:MAG: hypothetical protein J6Q87_06670 [Clostridia bacterium]|nr:hypothetical protein [Clostridia bacterium]